jgi:competence protein ComGC
LQVAVAETLKVGVNHQVVVAHLWVLLDFPIQLALAMAVAVDFQVEAEALVMALEAYLEARAALVYLLVAVQVVIHQNLVVEIPNSHHQAKVEQVGCQTEADLMVAQVVAEALDATTDKHQATVEQVAF